MRRGEEATEPDSGDVEMENYDDADDLDGFIAEEEVCPDCGDFLDDCSCGDTDDDFDEDEEEICECCEDEEEICECCEDEEEICECCEDEEEICECCEDEEEICECCEDEEEICECCEDEEEICECCEDEEEICECCEDEEEICECCEDEEEICECCEDEEEICECCEDEEEICECCEDEEEICECCGDHIESCECPICEFCNSVTVTEGYCEECSCCSGCCECEQYDDEEDDEVVEEYATPGMIHPDTKLRFATEGVPVVVTALDQSGSVNPINEETTPTEQETSPAPTDNNRDVPTVPLNDTEEVSVPSGVQSEEPVGESTDISSAVPNPVPPTQKKRFPKMSILKGHKTLMLMSVLAGLGTLQSLNIQPIAPVLRYAGLLKGDGSDGYKAFTDYVTATAKLNAAKKECSAKAATLKVDTPEGQIALAELGGELKIARDEFVAAQKHFLDQILARNPKMGKEEQDAILKSVKELKVPELAAVNLEEAAVAPKTPVQEVNKK